MKLWYGIVFLVAFWLVLVLRWAPAGWALWLADAPAQFSGVSGTIWSGSASNVVVPYQGDSYSLGKLEWETQPWSLLTGSPCADIHTELRSQQIRGEVCVGLGGDIEMTDMQISLPAAATELWLPVSVAGEILMRIDRLAIEDNAVSQLSGKGSWSNARFHNTQTWLDLGTVGFELAANGNGAIQARFFDVEGPLRVDLNSTIGLNGSYDTRGDIVLGDSAQPEIGQILAHIAEQVGQNHFRVQWVGG